VIGSCARVSLWTGRNIQSEGNIPRGVKPSKPGEGYGQAPMLSRGSIERASVRAEIRPIARMTPTHILEGDGELRVQSIFDHHEPSRYHRAFSGDEPIRWQSAADARCLSQLSCARGARRRHRAGDGDDALGNAATTEVAMAPGDQYPQHHSSHWRTWLKPENRCLIPANSFAEYAPEPNPETKKKDVVWFALNEDRPPFAQRDRSVRRAQRDKFLEFCAADCCSGRSPFGYDVNSATRRLIARRRPPP
jgi:hypothetical protein